MVSSSSEEFSINGIFSPPLFFAVFLAVPVFGFFEPVLWDATVLGLLGMG
jgi:hypothetical protein